MVIPQEVKENKLFLKRILTTCPCCVYVYNLDHKNLIYTNHYSDTLFGYAPKILMDSGKDFLLRLTHPEDLPRLQEHYKEIARLKDSEIKTIEIRIRPANGTWLWVNLRESVLKRDKYGEVRQILGNAIDVTAKKAREGRLEGNPDFIKSVMDATPGNIFLFDTQERKVIFDSLNALRSLGYRPVDIVKIGNQFFTRLLHPEDLPFVDAAVKKLNESQTGENVSYEARFRHADGGWRWFNVTLRPFKRDDRGMLSEAIGVAIEITRQKEAQIQLKESQDFFQKIFKASPNDIYVFDLVENRNIFANGNILNTLGYSPEEVVQLGDQFFSKLLHPDDFEVVHKNFQELRTLKTDQTLSAEVRLRHTNGNWRWLRVNSRPFKRNARGEVTQVVGISIDITERKEAEIKLKESEEFVTKITDAVPHFILVHDLVKNKIIFSNHALQDVLGFEKQLDIIRTYDIYSLIHPNDLPVFLESEKKILKISDNDVVECEIRIKASDGSYRWENMRGKIFKRNERGEVYQIVISAIDIHSRKESEEKLLQSQKFISKITETVPDIIYVFDLVKMRNIYINEAPLKILGYTQEEIKRMGDHLIPYLIHPEDLPGVFIHVGQIRKSVDDVVKTLEYRLKDAKNHWHWFIARQRTFDKDPDGTVTQVVGVATDITYIKKMEQELKELNTSLEKKVKERTNDLCRSEERLRQSENQLKIITNAIPALISYIDRNEIYWYANPSYYTIFKTTDDIEGMRMEDVIGVEAYETSRKNFTKALRGEIVSYENRISMKDGSVRTLNINLIPDKDEIDGIRGVVVMAVDLTDRIEYERNLEEKNVELKRINADLDNFVYTASHDLKTPIANLEGLLNGILEQSMTEKLSDDSAMMLNMMQMSIRRLKTTITELTEVSRIYRNHSEDKELLDIEVMIEEFKMEYADQVKESKAIILCQFEVRNILFSRKNFRSIIYNLLDNALKYRSPDRVPEIIVKTERFENNYLLLSVKDNGLGFDISQKDKVFGMFKRMHAHREGSGIGLYIVKQIVENSGGKVDVESEINKGSVFKIYFKI